MPERQKNRHTPGLQLREVFGVQELYPQRCAQSRDSATQCSRQKGRARHHSARQLLILPDFCAVARTGSGDRQVGCPDPIDTSRKTQRNPLRTTHASFPAPSTRVTHLIAEPRSSLEAAASIYYDLRMNGRREPSSWSINKHGNFRHAKRASRIRHPSIKPSQTINRSCA